MPDSTESRRTFLKGTMAAAVAAAASAVGQAQSSAEANRRAGSALPKTPPNIVLYVADQFRADFVGANGCNGSVHTPNLDALAARGKNFTYAVTNQPVC